MFTTLAFLFLLGNTPATASAKSAESSDSGKIFYRIAIERTTLVDTVTVDTLSVTLKSNAHELAAFDIKIGTDRPDIQITQIMPGSFYDSCRWEFFNAKSMQVTPGESNPPSLWQAIAISETIPDDTAPLCYHLDGEVEILKVVVSIKHELRASKKPAPLFFYWEDCSDNTISNRSGDTLALSSTIVDYFKVQLPAANQLFPTRMGTPRQCIAPNVPNRPRRLIEFHNGGIEFLPVKPASAPVDSTAK